MSLKLLRRPALQSFSFLVCRVRLALYQAAAAYISPAFERTEGPPAARAAPGGGSGARAATAVSGADMVAQTRRAAAAEVAEQCRLDRVVANLQASCSQAASAPPVSSKYAAVLVPLFEDPASGEVHVVLNQRSTKLKTHSGAAAAALQPDAAADAHTCAAG